MGRRNYPIRGPRTGGLVADQERERAVRRGGTPSFGIRRLLDQAAADTIKNETLQLQENKAVPSADKLKLRDQALGVTLLSQRVIANQLRRGNLPGYNLGIARAQIIRSDECDEREEQLVVKRGDIRVFQNRIVYADIISEEVEAEISGIHLALAAAGLKAVARKEKPYVPHLTLAETVGGMALSAAEQADIIEAFDTALPVHVDVEEWDSYPFDIFDTSVR